VKDLRVAVVVCNAPVGATQTNLEKLNFYVQEASKSHADIVCFPEMNITGYSNHPDIRELAQDIPGPISQTLTDLAASNSCAILAGMAAKEKDGSIVAAHMAAMPNGQLGVYRKCHIAPPEKEIYSPGNSIPLFNHQHTTFGIQLCYDAHFPELTARMANDGAEIIFMPHASPRGFAVHKQRSWLRHLTARAFDNSVFIVACNKTGVNGKGLTFPGNAVVLDPAGNIMGQCVHGRETMLVVDLKVEVFEKIRNNRMHFFLPHRRPELYS
jgi:N-carbamoylputrescine amidase